MVLRTTATLILLTASAFAQMSSFPKASYFRETFKKTNTRVELQPPARLQDYVKNGKLEMSLKDYLGLVMGNNTGIQIQYLSLETSRNNIMSAYGAWDPRATASFTPSIATKDPNPNVTGTSTTSHSWPLGFTFSQTLSTGQTISANGNGQKYVSVLGTNPSFSSGMGFNVTQPLIKNRGSYVNRIPLMQAQSRYKGQEFNLRNTLLSLVSSAENTYWNAISARETVYVQTKALEAAQFTWDFIQKQFNLGAISYLDTYNPQQSLAQSQLALENAKFTLRNAEDAVRQQIAADLDPSIRTLPLNLTESVDLPESEKIVPDREQAVQTALATHPSLKATMQNLDIDDLSLASAKNGLMPQLDFRVGYSGAGNGSYATGPSTVGSSLRKITDSAGATIPFPADFSPAQAAYISGLTGYSSIPGSPIYGGLGDAMSQLFGWGNPTYSASLTLTLPIRNRQASATMANAMIQKKNDTLQVRNQQQGIRLSVLNAVTSLEGAEKALELAVTVRDFSQKNYDAMQTKYSLGTEIQQNVVSAQQALANADLQVLNQKINLQKAVLQLYLQTGELLDRRGIVVKAP